MKAEVTATIHQTPDNVFAYFKDVEKIQQWAPVTNMKLLTDGPISVGSKFSQTVSALGRSFEAITEVTAYEESKLYAFKSTSGPLPFEQRFTLTPTDEGTKLEIVSEGEPGGFFKLAQPLIAPAVHKQLQDQVNKLKQLLEK